MKTVQLKHAYTKKLLQENMRAPKEQGWFNRIVNYANGGDFDLLMTQDKVEKLVAKENAIKRLTAKTDG